MDNSRDKEGKSGSTPYPLESLANYPLSVELIKTGLNLTINVNSV